ncbi:MAG: ABC transporter permease [Ktedonobacterales bacterium]
MDSIFSFSASNLIKPLLLSALVACAVLLVLGIREPHLARIGLRSIGRRRIRTVLIVAGLMLSTTFVASSLAIDDTITLAVKTVAVFNLGRIDEDVSGGTGQLGLFSTDFSTLLEGQLGHDSEIAGIAPSLVVPDTLVADLTARQVRGGVTALAYIPDDAGPLGNLRSLSGAPVSASALATGQVYLNHNLAVLLDGKTGDTLSLFSSLWPGHRYSFQVANIVNGGLLGDSPTIVLPLTGLQQILHAPGEINHIYIANAGNGLSGVHYSDDIAFDVENSVDFQLRVAEVKQQGVQLSLQAQDIFGRILTLFTLFSLSIGLLLIFLIFVLLAAERRTELGMARALGMRRSQIVSMLLFEGGVYDVLAAAGGMLSGLGLGILIVQLVSPAIARIGFPLQVSVQPGSMIVAFCLGLLFTLVTIWLAAWTVSRMTIAAALRDLPEPPSPGSSLLVLLRDVLRSGRRASGDPGQVIRAVGALLYGLVTCGLIPLAVGFFLLHRAALQYDLLLLSLGLSCVIVGVVLLLRASLLAIVATFVSRRANRSAPWVMLRATNAADRLTAVLIGGLLALYWSLPFDALSSIGLPRWNGGIQTFFVAGIMMVFGVVIALAPNLDILLAPLRWFTMFVPRRHIGRIALAYPGQHRFRTGVGLSLFALVCFTMVVMATIAASTTKNFDNLPSQAAGYDVAGQPLFAPIGGLNQLQRKIAGSSANGDIAATSSATPLPLGIIQPGAPNARWSVYPASEIQGAFLDGVGLPIVAHAQGYASDNAVWSAVRNHPGDVVIDSGALSYRDAAELGLQLPPPATAGQFLGPPIAAGLPGLSSLESISENTAADPNLATGGLPGPAALELNQYTLREVTLRLRGIVLGQGLIAPTTIWVSDSRGGAATKLTIIGIVDNPNGQVYGLMGSPATFAPTEKGLAPFGNEYYYFKVKPGVDPHTVAFALGSTLLNYGFETTVLEDVLLDVNGTRVFISRVLVGLVGLTLLVGMASLAVTGSRSVVERRQQIGMLRALGFRRMHVQAIFLFESLLIGAIGLVTGLFLGLILCRNVFAVNFFESYQSGLSLVIPWPELIAICIAALAASLIAALLPAIQAGLVTPADALRYE